VLDDYAANPQRVMRVASADSDRGGEIATGPLGALLAEGGLRSAPLRPAEGSLPFALNGRPEDREEAELRLARSLKQETAANDAPMARYVDRHLSWRISYRLARTRITPNQVTLANTALGFLSAWLFAMPSYGWRLVGSLLFLLSITIDGVDGELARLQMSETAWGAKLDVVTDNIVHVAIFVGVFAGCYRAAQDSTFLYLMGIQLGGFALDALATYLAVTTLHADNWIETVERWSGRDFAYLLVGFALINRLRWFCWGTAFGTYVFAFVLLWLTVRQRGRRPHDDARRAGGGA
jgi:phosphatidylglycerophosphate synthase